MEKVDLHSFEGYYQYWFSLLDGTITQRMAWELTEEKWHEITGSKRMRYSSLESFLAAKGRYFKNGRI